MSSSKQHSVNGGDHSSGPNGHGGRGAPGLDQGGSAWWRHPLAADWLCAESQQARQMLGSLRGQQVLELLPEGAPALSLPEAEVITWSQSRQHWLAPVHACHRHLPVVDAGVDVVLWRYLEMSPADRMALLGDIHRSLRGGGQLLIAALNPLQPACWRACDWRQLGQQALEMSWPLSPRGFRTVAWAGAGGRRLLQPVRLLLLRKFHDPRIIQPRHDRLMKAVKNPAASSVPSCRAA